MSVTELRFLLISDIHFGSLAESGDFALEGSPPPHAISGAVAMKRSLIEALTGKRIAALLVSGDLTSSGGPAEFCQCRDAILGIADALGIQRGAIFLAFGNHDVDWRISELAREGRPDADPRYKDVAAHVGSIFIEAGNATKLGPLPGCAVHECEQYVVITANTGYFCTKDQVYRHGRLGAEQLGWLASETNKLKTDDKRWRILLLHHHLYKYPYPTPTEDISEVEESAELRDIVGRSKIDIVCHGHRHHPIHHTIMISEWAAPVTFLCAGSLAVNAVERRHGEIPNVCHVVTLTSRETGCATGHIETLRYGSSEGWVPVSYSPVVPFDAVQRFGSIATEDECRRHVCDIISQAMSDDDYIDLPQYESLPYPLRCMPVTKLNALVKEVASTAYSRKIIGDYPGPHVILRK
jgi:predicted phosphodiesterase